jgi:mxaJ protein
MRRQVAGMPNCRWILAALALLGCSSQKTARELRVCSDPNNLPFSNQKGEGLENHLAQLIARELQANVRYTW